MKDFLSQWSMKKKIVAAVLALCLICGGVAGVMQLTKSQPTQAQPAASSSSTSEDENAPANTTPPAGQATATPSATPNAGGNTADKELVKVIGTSATPTPAPNGGGTPTPTPDNGGGTPTPTPDGGGSDPTPPPTVYYVVTEHIGEEVKEETVQSGTLFSSLGVPTQKGYVFLGWYYDSDNTNRVLSTDTVTKNISVYAAFAESKTNLGSGILDYITTTVGAGDTFSAIQVVSPNGTPVAATGEEDKATADFVMTLSGAVVPVEITDNGGTYSIAPVGGFVPGNTYQLALNNNAITFQGQDAGVRYYNVVLEKQQIDELELSSGMKFIAKDDAALSDLTGYIPGLFSLSGNEVETLQSSGTFQYTGDEALAVGDIVAIYTGEKPSDRTVMDASYGDVAYVKILGIDGSVFSYESAAPEEVLFTPDVFPIAVQDNEQDKTELDVDEARMNLSAYSEIGLDHAIIEAGDFIQFYTDTDEDNVADEGEAPVAYAKITKVEEKVVTPDVEQGIEGFAGYTLTYEIVDEATVLSVMELYDNAEQAVDIYNTLTAEEKAKLENDMVTSAMESGFVEQASVYLAEQALLTEDAQNAMLANGIDPSDVTVVLDDDTSGMNLQATESKVQIEDLRAIPYISGSMDHLSGSGLQVKLIVSFTLKIGESVSIEVQAEFIQEVMVKINVSGGAEWKTWYFIPYIDEYVMTANIDVGTYTGIAIVANMTIEGDDDDEDDKKIELGKDDDDDNSLQEQLELLMSEQDSLFGDSSAEDLVDRYSSMLENDTDWVDIIDVSLFRVSGAVDPFHILAYHVYADFVVSADVNVALGMNFEYANAKRYTYHLRIFDATCTSNTIDLETAHYNFDFYVMGKLGLRAGVRLEVAVGFFDTKLDSIGVIAECGAYTELCGYFYYHLDWTAGQGKNSGYDGAFYIEVGAYLQVDLMVQLGDGKVSYNPTLYEQEWPMWSAGDIYNVLDFADGGSPLTLTMVRVPTYTLPDSVLSMSCLDLSDGKTKNKVLDDESESRFTISFSNPQFSYNPRNNTISITLDSSGAAKVDGEMTITYTGARLAYSTNVISRTIKLSYVNPQDGRCIYFDTQGGVGSSVIYKLKGSAITAADKASVVTPTRMGYSFGGWYTNTTCTAGHEFAFPDKIPDEDMRVYAKWVPNTDTAYTVEYYLQELASAKYTLQKDDTQELKGTTNTAITPEIKEYAGFTVQTPEQQIIAGDGSSVVRVYYTRNKYTVRYASSVHEDEVATTSYKFGAAIVPPTLTTAGYTATKQWFTTAECNEEYVFPATMPAEDITAYAGFTANSDTPYRVEYYLQNTDGKTYTYDSAAVFYGETGKAIDFDAARSFRTIEDFTYELAKVGEDEFTESNVPAIAADGTLAVKLYYTRNSYKATFTSGYGEEEETLAELDVLYGAPITTPETTPTRTGYTFARWSGITATTTMPAKATTHKAIWTPNADTAYTVEYYGQNANDDEYTLLETVPMTGTTDATVTAAANEYANFTLDEAAADALPTAKVAADGTLVLKLYYARNSFNMTFTTGYGDNETVATTAFRVGQTVTAPEPAPTRTGYTLSGWDGLTSETVMPAKNSSMKALWTANTVTVSFDAGTGTPERATQDVTFDSIYGALPNAARVGYMLEGWYTDNTYATQVTADSNVTNPEAHTLYAKWVAGDGTAYTVEHYLQSIDETYPTAPESTENKTGKTDTDTAAAAMSFAGFTAPASVTQQTIKGDGSTVIKLYYTRNSYDLTFVFGNGSDNSVTNVKYGAAISAPNDPTRTGYTFAGWSSTVPATMPAENQTFTAQWEIQHYNVSFNLNGAEGGIATQSIEHGKTATKPTDPTRTGYTFAGWFVNDEATEAYDFATQVTGAVALKARWTGATYTVTYHFETEYDIYGTPTKQVTFGSAYGELLDIDPEYSWESLDKNLYTESGWATQPEGKGTKVDAQTIVTTAGNHDLYAYRVYMTSTITYNLNGGNNDPRNPAKVENGTPAHGSDFDTMYMAIYPPTMATYQFTGWIVNDGIKTQPDGDHFDVCILSVDENGLYLPYPDITLTATWEPLPFTLSFSDTSGTLGTNALYYAADGTLLGTDCLTAERNTTVALPVYAETSSGVVVPIAGWYTGQQLSAEQKLTEEEAAAYLLSSETTLYADTSGYDSIYTYIASQKHLAALNGTSTGTYMLACDVQLTNWTAGIASFKATLDGNGYSIVYDETCTAPVIKQLEAGAVVKNLTLDGVAGSDSSGLLLVKNNYGTVTYCTNKLANKYTAGVNTAGLVLVNYGNITYCTNEAAINGPGIAYFTVSGSLIDHCTNTGNAVEAGIVSRIWGGTVSNCTTKDCTITADSLCGGEGGGGIAFEVGVGPWNVSDWENYDTSDIKINDCTVDNVIFTMNQDYHSITVGGIAGRVCSNTHQVSIISCNATGGKINVVNKGGDATVGGIVGIADGNFTMSDCLCDIGMSDVDNPDGTVNVGGLLGRAGYYFINGTTQMVDNCKVGDDFGCFLYGGYKTYHVGIFAGSITSQTTIRYCVKYATYTPGNPNVGDLNGGIEVNNTIEKPASTYSLQAEDVIGEEPADSEPADSEPATPESADSEPADSEPADSLPAESVPADSEPADSEPASSEPASSELPASSEPANSELPASSEPAAQSTEIKDPVTDSE